MPGRLVSEGQATPGPQVASPTGRPVPARRTLLDYHHTDNSMTMDVPGLPGLPGNDYMTAAAVGPESTHKGVPDVPRHSADHRYSHLASPLTTHRKVIAQAGPQFQRQGLVVRPQSAMGLMSPPGRTTPSAGHQYHGHQVYERPPSAMGTSWTTRGPVEGKPAPMRVADGPSLESRLQALMTDTTAHMRTEPSTSSPHQRSYSHGDGYSTRGPNVNDVKPHAGNADDVYATVFRRQEMEPRQRQGMGYSPLPGYNSRPGSQRQASGRDNHTYSPDSPGKPTPSRAETQGVGSSSLELRNAWQKLYGSHHEVSHMSRTMHDQPRPVSRQEVRIPDSQSPPYDRQYTSPSSTRRPGSAMKQMGDDLSVDVTSNSPSYHVPSSHASPNMGNFSQGHTGVRSGDEISPGSYATFNRYGRQSPTGQSSSNQDPVSGSHNSSGLSSQSGNTRATMSTSFHHGNISPASKYPDSDFGLTQRSTLDSPRKKQQGRQTPKISSSSNQQMQNMDMIDRTKRNEIAENLRNTPSFQVSFSGSEDESDPNYPLGAMDSIFDFNFNDLPSETESYTAQAASMASHHVDSPRAKDAYGSPSPKISPDHPRTKSPGQIEHSSPQGRLQSADNWQTERAIPIQVDEKQTKVEPTHIRQHLLTDYARSRSLEDVRESGGESDLSFDVENTFLMVEPSDQSEMGTLKSKSSSMRAQLNRLEGMYSKVMKTLEDKSPGAPRTTRRWSIGSSDTSSLRHQNHHGKHSRSAQSQRMSSKDVRSIGKRFQRLESHVITLARSVAHLSSELRSQNTMTREIENVKREMQELKNQSFLRPSGGGRSELDKYRGWIPPLTNPRRVNKLTKFFGQEPPLLEIFLKRLGYERYVKNFEQEHIGMMELPYMTEDRLQSIGIPMGPRLRILQESQMCFTHDDFNIYIV